MKTTAIAISFLLAATTFAAFIPGASAVGWCVEGVPTHDCTSHYVCVGRSTSGQSETCQVGIRNICDAMPCGWWPVLP